MAAEAATLQLIWYQIQQETVYYITETDPVKKQQHSNNLAHLYALLDLLLKSQAPQKKGFHLLHHHRRHQQQFKVCAFPLCRFYSTVQ